MICKLALGFICANALVVGMAAATLAGQHNQPPTVTPTPATSMTMPAITVRTPDIGYIAPTRAIGVVTPAPLPRSRSADIAPIERSTRAVAARLPRHADKPRLRKNPKANDSALLPHGSMAMLSEKGGRGFL